MPKLTEKPNNSEPKQAENAVTDIQLPTCSTTQKTIIPAFSCPASVKADIVLAMKSVTSHLSARSMDDLPEIIQYICPNSQIIKQVYLHRTKLEYIVNQGLAPYFKEKPISSVKEAAYFVFSFDESFNSESNKKLLDAHVNFFNDKSNHVERKYIGSCFIGHRDAETCLKSLIDILGNLDYANNLIQMGVDGPNVNWNLFDMMKQDRLEKNSKVQPMLELGSCGLHVVHGVFGTTESATDWNLAKFLRNCFSILKKSSAQRSDYLQANDLHDAHEGKDTSYLFPLKFCGHRWLENTKVISRIIDILPYLQKYFQWLLTEKKIPKKNELLSF